MKVIIEIEGGCLREIRSDEPLKADVLLVDWDNEDPIEEVAEVAFAQRSSSKPLLARPSYRLAG